MHLLCRIRIDCDDIQLMLRGIWHHLRNDQLWRGQHLYGRERAARCVLLRHRIRLHIHHQHRLRGYQRQLRRVRAGLQLRRA